MKILIKLIIIIGFLQVKCFAFAQMSSGKTGNYIFTFNPVYASGLIDMSYVAFDDLYLIVSDTPLKMDSVMSVLGKKSYSTMRGILDTMRQHFKVYNVVENDTKAKTVDRISKMLNDCSHYGSNYLFSLNDSIKKSSSLVGFVIRRYTFLEARIRYKALNEDCGDFPNECRAVITNL